MNENRRKGERKTGVHISNLTYPTSGSMVKQGISTREIKALRTSGQLLRIKRGLYRVKGSPLMEVQDFIDVAQAVPDGIICLTSALAYHNLTTLNPSFVTVALRKGSRIPIVEYPPVEFYLFGNRIFELGIENIKEGGFEFRIYDREKTVCDCMRYRNKIGIDVAKEGLKEYLKLKDRSLSKLSQYAEICRVKTIMNNWLDALV
jgi:predicted transcriptional regulator of viral defense system